MAEEMELVRVADPMLALVSKAIEKNMDGAQLREILALRRDYEADEAKKGYARAMAQFQTICPRVMKRHRAEIPGKFGYQFANFDDIMRAIAPALEETGLSVAFTTEIPRDKNGDMIPGWLTVICLIRWGLHEEARPFTAPIPQMTVNDTQRYGAALSYAKRYALTTALNITTTDVDDDARGLIDAITDDQREELLDLLGRKGRSVEQLMKYLNFPADSRMEDMSARFYGLAKDALLKMPEVKT